MPRPLKVEGTPMFGMSLKQLEINEPGKVSARIFFDTVCSRVLRTRRRECADLGGSYGFDLTGPKGGVWVLDFARARVKRERGLPEGLTLSLSLSTDDFERLLTGSLDVPAASASGRLRVRGERRGLRALRTVLTPL